MRTGFTGNTGIGKAAAMAAGAALFFLLAPGPAPAARLMPSDLEYLGAFRLPGAGGENGWGWGGNALAYRPGEIRTAPPTGTRARSSGPATTGTSMFPRSVSRSR